MGGGLAQHASYNKGYKAVTFNSAPFPISHNLDTYNIPKPVDVVNIMSNKDPLTSTLFIVEDYENAGHDFTKPYHEGELLTPISEILRKYDNEHTGLKLKAATLLALGSNDAGDVIQDRFADGLASVANDYSNSSVLKLLTSYYSTQNQSNLQDFLDALNALKDKDVQGFITHTKKAFDIESIKLNNLLIGQRVVVNTGTGHGMLDLLKASYRNINNLGLERIKTTNPEFYKYIKGTFVNGGVPYPQNSRMKDSLTSRMMNYYYVNAYDDVLESKVNLLYSQVKDIQATQTQIENFAGKYLKFGSLITQGLISVSDAMIGSDNLSEETKRRAVTFIVDSGKDEVVNAYLNDEQKQYLDIFEGCVVGLPWFSSVSDVSSDAIKELIGEAPEKLIDCAMGETSKAVGRFVNAGRGLLSLSKYNSFRVAHKYLDRYYVCGINNNSCMADAFGGKTDLDEQLQFIMESIGATDGDLDWRIRRGAKTVIFDTQKKLADISLKVLSYISTEVQYEYNHGNRQTNTLDGFLRVVDYDEVENILWVNMRVENTSGREIMLTSFLPLIISEGVETNLGGNTNDDIFDSFLGKTLVAGESRTFKSLPINLGELKIKDKARLALLIDYQSTDGAFKDHIQRIANFDVSTPTEDSMVQTIPYSGNSGIINFELPANTTLSNGIVEGSKGDTVSFSLGYDAKYLRECLAKAEEGTPHYKIQYIDKSVDESNTKVETQALWFDSHDYSYEFVMPSDKIELVDVSYVDFDTDDREVMHCPLPEWSNFISNDDTNTTDNNSTDSNATGETYEECVARGGSEIGCKVGMVEISEIYVDSGTNYGGLEVKGSYAYVGSAFDGFSILDISSKEKPKIINKKLKNMDANDVKVIDNYAYVASFSDGFQIINLNSKEEPTIEGSTKNVYVRSIEKISGNYAYCISQYFKLLMIDISSKDNPKVVHTFELKPESIEVIGNKLYIARGYRGLDIYDITTRNKISHIDYTGKSINYIKKIDNYLYVSTFSDETGNQLEITTIEKLMKGFTSISSLHILSGAIKEIDTVDKYIFVRDERHIYIVDTTLKFSPILIQTVAGFFNEPKSTMALSSNYMYVLKDRKFTIIDWKNLIKKYKNINDYLDTNLKLKSETYTDYSIVNNKFTKTWIFNKDISSYKIDYIFNSYSTSLWHNMSQFVINGNKLSIELTPNNALPVNKLEVRLLRNSTPIKVSGSETFWSKTKTKANKAPKLADGQLGTLSGNSNGEYAIKTYDGDGQATTLSVVDSAGGDVSIEGDTIHTSFDDGKSSHTIEVAISDGTETVVKEFTVLTLSEEAMANYYSDVPTSHKDFDAIAFATQKGVVEGQIDVATGKHIFRPDDDASLAEVLKMVIKAESSAGLIDLETSEYYREVFPSWAMPYYSYARDVDAIEHESTDLSAVYPTREEIARLIVKTLHLESKLDLKKGAIGFDDIDSFSNEEMAHYAEYTKLFGLFMTNKNARPQETISRGELAEVIAKIFMIPKATLKVTPNKVEYGDSIESSLTNVFAQSIDPSTHMLQDTQDELNITYVAKGIAVATSTIDTNSIPSSTKTIYAILDNNGVRNIISALIQLDFNDQDNDGVQDKNDKWTDDARYAYDANNNGIPDILDIVYGLGDKTPSDTILIDGQEVPVEDVIFYGGWKASDEPILTLQQEINGTIEKGSIKYYKLKVKSGQHVHIVLSNLSANLDLYVQDVKRPKPSDFVGGSGVSSGEQATISMGSSWTGRHNEELDFIATEDIDVYIGVNGTEKGSYTLKAVEHADYVMSLEFNTSISTTIHEAFSYYSIHGTKGDSIKIQINTNTPPFGDFNNSGTMFVKVGIKPSDTLYDCKKAFSENNIYECVVKLDSEDDVYIALKTTNGTGSIGLVATLMEVDTDNDGIPDSEDEDDDNDGVVDGLDAFPLNPNESIDTDHDGRGNNADTDDDNDGISDADENKWGFDPLDASDGGNADTDGDGVSNADEIEAGSNPLDSSDTKKPKKFVPIIMDDMVVMVPMPQYY